MVLCFRRVNIHPAYGVFYRIGSWGVMMCMVIVIHYSTLI